MIPIYKLGGDHKKNGVNYSFKVINPQDIYDYTDDGWVRNFKDLEIEEAVYTEIKPKKEKVNDNADDKQS